MGDAALAALVRANAGHEDRLVRQAAARLAARLPECRRAELAAGANSGAARITLGFAMCRTDPAAARRLALSVIGEAAAQFRDRLDAARLLQVALGDLTDSKAVGGAFEGYTPRRPVDPTTAKQAAAVLRSAFPSGHRDLDRELTRTLAVLADDDPAAVAKVLAAVTADSDPADDVHALIVLARLPARRTAEQTRSTAEALLKLEEKAVRRTVPRDRHWPLRVAEAAAGIAKHDPALAAALLASERFGLAGHVVFARLPGLDRLAAARRFLARAKTDPDFAWQGEHVALLGEWPPEEVRDVLPRLWDRGGLEDALLPLLARRPAAADRARFLAGLRSPHPAAVAAAAAALRQIPSDHAGPEVAALVRALRGLPAGESAARRELAATLRVRTGADLGPDAAVWTRWVEANHPAAAKELAAAAAGVAGARKRLAGIDWAAGDPAAGAKVFARASCAACHNGAQAVGPSLEGVAGRFSRDDLITAVIDPNRDVPARYRATKVTTDDGRTYQGVVIYEANDGLILQTGAAETVRVAGGRVESKQPLDGSLMPAGLLDPLSDREVADLFAYLRTLGKPAGKP